MNSYELSRKFIDFSFENPSKIKPNHYAMYFFSIEHCNRLGWKKEFGLPTTMTMEAIGIKSYNTYINTFNDLIDFGFYKLVQRSKNQYSSNIIELSNFNKALDKALDKAFIKHESKQSESIVSINKPINKEQVNKEKTKKEKIEGFLNWFNLQKKVHTGKLGKFKMLTKTDENNLFKLLKVYNHKDFEEAIPKLYDSQWAKENQMFTPSHFLRNENFNKYLNQEIEKETIGLG